MPAAHDKNYRKLALLAAAFALIVVVFGAFVRLSNAGLSCPDWPTCYGRLTWPTHEQDIASANAAYPSRPVESGKAWREQVHRFLAGGLIVTTFALAYWSWRRRREPGQPWRVPLAAAVLIVFQALLGMLTVTWKLKPVVVMAHLLGGMATFALLVWTAARVWAVQAARRENTPHPVPSPRSAGRGGVIIGLRPTSYFIGAGIALVALQIALGGWTSSNYAAFACGTDFPRCLGQWWPATDFREAFVLWRGIGVDYEGGVLDGPARVAIQFSHRLFALAVAAYLAVFALRCLRIEAWRGMGALVLILLALQLALGIGNVMLGLPLWLATLHNAGAALLLATLVAMLARASGTMRP
jgi:cytochrome c oxidase assembly protein subunit 15